MTTAVSRAHREERFTDLAARVYGPLQRYAARRVADHEVDDVVAESLLVLWRRLDEIPADGEVPWAYAVARHVIANQRRSTVRRDRLTVRLAALPEQHAPAADLVTSGPVDDPAVAAALDRLGPRDREIVLLWAWEGLAPREIAAVLGGSVNAVTLRLSRARRRLRAELGGQNTTPTGQVLDNGERRDR